MLLDSTIAAAARDVAILRFDNETEPEICITTYPINIARQDCQHQCCTVFMVEPGCNLAMEMQIGQRVHRFGQTEDVEVVRLFVEDTYNEIQENFML